MELVMDYERILKGLNIEPVELIQELPCSFYNGGVRIMKCISAFEFWRVVASGMLAANEDWRGSLENHVDEVFDQTNSFIEYGHEIFTKLDKNFPLYLIDEENMKMWVSTELVICVLDYYNVIQIKEDI